MSKAEDIDDVTGLSAAEMEEIAEELYAQSPGRSAS